MSIYMNQDKCSVPDRMVTLQSNGIIRDETHTIIGRLVENVDSLCEEFYKRGMQDSLKRKQNENIQESTKE